VPSAPETTLDLTKANQWEKGLCNTSTTGYLCAEEGLWSLLILEPPKGEDYIPYQLAHNKFWTPVDHTGSLGSKVSSHKWSGQAKYRRSLQREVIASPSARCITWTPKRAI
jgi:hypothetical protein